MKTTCVALVLVALLVFASLSETEAQLRPRFGRFGGRGFSMFGGRGFRGFGGVGFGRRGFGGIGFGRRGFGGRGFGRGFLGGLLLGGLLRRGFG